MAQGEDGLRRDVRISAPGQVQERDVKSLEAWLRGEPELQGRVQVKRGARRTEAGVPMGPQLDIVLHLVDWAGSAAAAELMRRVAGSIKEWRTSRRALGDPDPPDFRAELDDERA
ncbi:hypothetical protein AB0K09_19690 [Streptomyces sp. NPDC049577]|uniref:effector-associated constant component EACC1 n=1 Tax=Streptomyces sp. NPDC049577 TaxID=3155153 RepID=UPI003428B3E2